jgi:beta-xylosidase
VEGRQPPDSSAFATPGPRPADVKLALVSAPPVDLRDFPDPFVLNAEGTYYAFATNAGPTNVQAMSSTDLIDWKTLPDALPSLPVWAARGFTWAPSILVLPTAYVLYYTVREPNGARQAISVARSIDAQGPYVDTGTAPLIYQVSLGGSIDPSPFVDADGTAYLLWKADANAIDQPSSVWAQPLASDGLSLAGSATHLLDFDAYWEDPLIEAPSMVLANGTYYLFYSANWWNTERYAIGYATASNVLGPYTKVTTGGPWFASDANVTGPGGQEWFTDSSGQLRMAYHGWQPGRAGYPDGARSLRLASVSFIDGTPIPF